MPRKNIPVLWSTSIFFLTLFFSFTIASNYSYTCAANKYCQAGGNAEAGKGGAEGDKCFVANDECCKAPSDGSPTLHCDADKNSPTFQTCKSGFNQAKSECSDDSQCDAAKDLICDKGKGKCVPSNCSKDAGKTCAGAKDCCKTANLTCDTNTHICTATKCSDNGGPCGAGQSCCQGKNLACNKNKCESSCKQHGDQCSPDGGSGGCCGDQNLVCDKDKVVNKDKITCVTKDEIDKNQDDEPRLPAPPSPPCADGAFQNGKCTAIPTALGDLSTNPEGFIKSLFAALLSISGGIALLLIMKSGYVIMTANGKPEAIQSGRDQLVAAIVGLIFLIFSFVILQVIGVDVLRIPGFK